MSNNTRIVKYAAVASAVAAACSASISWGAATISPGATKVLSAQFAASSTTANDIAPNDFSVNISDQTYIVGDIVTVGITGASLRTPTAGAVVPSSVTCRKTAGTSTMVLGYLAKSSSAVSYRVLSSSTGLDQNGFSCNFSGGDFSVALSSATTIGASAIQVTYRANNQSESGTEFDTASPSRVVIAVRNQYSAAVVSGESFSGTVDVATGRTAWTGATTATLSRSLQISLDGTISGTSTNFDSGLSNKKAETSYSVAVYGAGNGTEAAFSFLDDNGDGCTAADLTAGVGTASVSPAANTLTVSANCATLTITRSGVAGASTDGTNNANDGTAVTLSLTKSGTSGLVIADGSFTVAPTFTAFQSGGRSVDRVITAFAGGSFGLNGTVTNIPYVPYGLSGTSEITQSYYITNRSATSGAVTGVAYNEAGTSCNLGTVGTASARRVTNLSTAINSAIAGCYAGSTTAAISAFPSGTRVYVTLTSNTPAASTEVNATYNVGGNSRVSVINDSIKTRSAQ